MKTIHYILDTRDPEDFSNGFIPGSVFIGLDGRFAEWAGSLLPFDKPILLICDNGKEEEAVIRLARVGFENVEGYLRGGFDTWKKAGEKIDLIINVEADELAMDIPFDDHLTVLDVRKFTEFADGHVKMRLIYLWQKWRMWLKLHNWKKIRISIYNAAPATGVLLRLLF